MLIKKLPGFAAILIMMLFTSVSGFAQIDRFLIIVSERLSDTGDPHINNAFSNALTAYEDDINKEGVTTTVLTGSWATEGALKNEIKNYYDQGYRGMVFIGGAPDIPNVYWKYKDTDSVPLVTDVYYSDLDYTDKDPWLGNKYETITIDNVVHNVYVIYEENANGEPIPINNNNDRPMQEMIHGRIDAKKLSTSLKDEAQKITGYLEKIHEYRTNYIYSNFRLTPEEYNSGFYWSDDSWVFSNLNETEKEPWEKPKTGQWAIAGDIMYLTDYTVTSKSFLKDRLELGALTGIIYCHTTPSYFIIEEWDEITHVNVNTSFNNDFLDTISPKVHMLYLFCCSAANFTEKNLAAQFLFNDYTFTVFGKTNPSNIPLHNKGEELYTAINNGKTVGEAFLRDITQTYDSSTTSATPYHSSLLLGHILLGDPLITYNNTNNAFDQSPFIKSDLKRLEAAVGKTFYLEFDIDYSQPYYVKLEPINDTVLPDNMEFDKVTNNDKDRYIITFTPTIDQVETTYYLKVTATANDNPNNMHSEIFTIYVTYVENQLLINNRAEWDKNQPGWEITKENAEIVTDFSRTLYPIPSKYREYSRSKFKRMIPKIGDEQNGSTGYLQLTQKNIQIKPYRRYEVFFYISNALSSGAEFVSFEIPELNFKRPLTRGKEFRQGKGFRQMEGFIFDVRRNLDKITLNLNIGDSQNWITGDIAIEMMKIQDVGAVSFEPPKTISVSNLKFVELENLFQKTKIDTTYLGNPGKPLTINTQKYYKGFGVRAGSTLCVPLNGKYTKFTSYIGVDDEIMTADPNNPPTGDDGKVIFEVYLDDACVPERSVEKNRQESATLIEIDVTGANELLLVVDDAGNPNYDHADWADAKLYASETQYISDHVFYEGENGLGHVEINKSNGQDATGDGNTITLNGEEYVKGLGVHANSAVLVPLNGMYTQFTSDIGVDDEIVELDPDNNPSYGTVKFGVFLDNENPHLSGVMGRAEKDNFDIDVSGVRNMILIVDGGGDGNNLDHADWANARLRPAENIYQAETEEYVKWENADVKSDGSNYFGIGYVDTADVNGTWVEWEVHMENAVSNAQVEIRFANADNTDRTMDIFVNGDIQKYNVSFQCLGTDWDTWDVQTVNLNLNAGTNTIRVVATTDHGAPNLDQLEITY